MRADEAASEEGEELDGPTGNLKILGSERVDAEGFDDQRAELEDVSVGDAESTKHTLVKAALGICAPVAMTKRIQVFGSLSVCHA